MKPSARDRGSPEGFLGDDLELVAGPGRDDLEAGHADLGRLPAAIPDFELAQRVLDLGGIELENGNIVADLDPRLLEQRQVRCLPSSPLPEEVEATILASRAESLGGLGTGEVGDVFELIRGEDDGELDVKRIELSCVLLDAIPVLEDDAPALFGGEPAVAGSHAD